MGFTKQPEGLEALNDLCQQGCQPAEEARLLHRTVERLLAHPLSKGILAGTYRSGDQIVVEVDETGLTFRKHSERTTTN